LVQVNLISELKGHGNVIPCMFNIFLINISLRKNNT
jgi:hypothetical protein